MRVDRFKSLHGDRAFVGCGRGDGGRSDGGIRVHRTIVSRRRAHVCVESSAKWTRFPTTRPRRGFQRTRRRASRDLDTSETCPLDVAVLRAAGKLNILGTLFIVRSRSIFRTVYKKKNGRIERNIRPCARLAAVFDFRNLSGGSRRTECRARTNETQTPDRSRIIIIRVYWARTRFPCAYTGKPNSVPTK